ncbi:hypothetical protein QUF56_04385 [Ureibacillus composti]|nr:hypothetical protein [Ureibacillus composti]
MSTFTVLSKKEFTQQVRDFKIIWLPLVFILLGLTQPIMMYYLPMILNAVGGVEGITLDPSLTKVEGTEILASTLSSQFDQLGIIILVVALMSIVQNDQANGMMAFILSRPVTVFSYVSSKIVSHYVLVVVSVWLGFTVSYGYANYLFTTIPFTKMFLTILLYSVWLLFVVTLVTMMSTIFNSQAFIAMISLFVLLVLRMIVGLHPIMLLINPAGASVRAASFLSTGEIGDGWLVNILIVFLLVLLMVGYTNYRIRKKGF